MERKLDWLALSAIALALLGSALLYPRLPEPMPIHWNAAGQPDDYGSRFVGAFLLPLVAAGIYLLFEVLPAIDPRKENYAKFSDTYHFLRRAFVLFMVLLHGLTLYAILLGDSLLSSWLVTAAVGFLFILIGNYMPRVRSNWFVGFRTPWTLSDDRIWRRTHRVGGQVFVVSGLAMMVAAVLPAGWQLVVLLGAILAMVAVPTAYSYWLFRQMEGGEAA